MDIVDFVVWVLIIIGLHVLWTLANRGLLEWQLARWRRKQREEETEEAKDE